MNNVFYQIDYDYYVNLDHVVAVDFTEDDILCDSVLTISLSDGTEYTFTLFELVDDGFRMESIIGFLNYIKLYNLANTIGSYVHDLKLK